MNPEFPANAQPFVAAHDIVAVTMLSYDWPTACFALRSMAKLADRIVVGVERNRLLWWVDRTFALPQNWEACVRAAAEPRSVRIVEYDRDPRTRAPGHTEHDRDWAEGDLRSALSAIAGHSARGAPSWVVHLDCDEVLVEPERLRSWLHSLPQGSMTSVISAPWFDTVLKVVGDVAVVASPPPAVRMDLVVSGAGQHLNSGRMVSPHLRRIYCDFAKIMHWKFVNNVFSGSLKLASAVPYHGSDEERLLAFLASLDPATCAALVDPFPYGDGVSWHTLRAVPLAEVPGGVPPVVLAAALEEEERP
ncbi:MAG: hypothetical protein PHR30_18450 [Gallionellaceae bacterium]|nr:hypothetical protein [Gallionellaceae bacterium]